MRTSTAADRPFVVMTGLPGSGKSTLAQRLAPLLDLPVIDKDQIHERLFEAEGIGNQEWRRTLSRESDEIFHQEPSIRRERSWFLSGICPAWPLIRERRRNGSGSFPTASLTFIPPARPRLLRNAVFGENAILAISTVNRPKTRSLQVSGRPHISDHSTSAIGSKWKHLTGTPS